MRQELRALCHTQTSVQFRPVLLCTLSRWLDDHGQPPHRHPPALTMLPTAVAVLETRVRVQEVVVVSCSCCRSQCIPTSSCSQPANTYHIRWALRACSRHPPGPHTFKPCCDADPRCDPFPNTSRKLISYLERDPYVWFQTLEINERLLVCSSCLCSPKARHWCAHTTFSLDHFFFTHDFGCLASSTSNFQLQSSAKFLTM